MKFINFKQGDGPEGLFEDECDAPAVSADQIRIQVHAFGVNRADTLQRMGKYPPPAGESPILGLEVAGTVDEVGSEVSRWKKGERVFALVPGGGYAERVLVNADHVMPIPNGISFTQAAGIAEVFLTAYQSLFLVGQVKSDQQVLIHAGASAVGLAATQLATLTGAHVAVTASTEDKLSLCQKMGAKVLINYKNQDFANEIANQVKGGINFILDFIGGDYLNRNLKVLAVDGMIVYLAMLAGRYADHLDMAMLLKKRATIAASTLRNRSDVYKARLVSEFTHDCLPAFTDGKLIANIDTVYPVSEIRQAHQRLHENDTQGKLIIEW